MFGSTQQPRGKREYTPDDLEQPQSSATGAFVRSAERSFLPTAVGFGAQRLAQIGLAPFITPFGSTVASVPIGMGAAYLTEKAQNWAANLTGLGPNAAQERADVEQHPTAQWLGEMAPAAVGLRPGAAALKTRAVGPRHYQQIPYPRGGIGLLHWD